MVAMSLVPVKIEGHTLPRRLVKAVRDGEWVPPADVSILESIFGERPVSPWFMSLTEMRRENRQWVTDFRDGNADEYLGDGFAREDPGDIDPELSLIIADLGPDQLVALDYRSDKKSPRVLYLRPRGGWDIVCASIDELIRQMQSPARSG
jgi:hypothetical protein